MLLFLLTRYKIHKNKLSCALGLVIGVSGAALHADPLEAIALPSAEQTNADSSTIDPQSSPFSLPQFDQAEIAEYEQALVALGDVYQKLNLFCESIANIVNNNSLRGVTNKKEVIENLRNYRIFINACLESQGPIQDPLQKIYNLAVLAEEVSVNLNKAIVSALKDFPKLDNSPDAVLARRTMFRSKPNLAQIKKQIDRVGRQVKSLKKKAPNIGLTHFNKMYRTMEKLNDRYGVLNKAAWTVGIGVGLGITYFMVDKELLQKWNLYLQWLKDWMGHPSHSKYGVEGVPADKRGTLTYVHAFLQNVADFSVTKIAVGAFIGAKLSGAWDTASEYVTAKGRQLASYLRGGPVVKISEGIYLKDPTITLDDIIGNEHNKAELEPLLHYLVDYDNFDRAGLVPETGYLFAGSPRTGKTHMAEAFAGSVQRLLKAAGKIEQLRFVTLTPAAFKSLGVKPGESRTAGILNTLLGAREFAPVVIFIDEFDMGGWQRERDTEALGELLTAMSELNKDKLRKVVVIAATNAPDNLDKALRKPGRFGKELYFVYPTMEERLTFLHRELSKRAIIINEEFFSFLVQVARETEGVSYDGLSRLVIVALLRAKMRQSSLEPMDLEMALDQEVRHMQPALLDSMSDKEQKLVSAHLAGHVIAHQALNGRNKVVKVTICPISPKVKESMILDKYDAKKNKDHNGSNIDKKPAFRYGAIFNLRSEQDTIASSDDLTIKAKAKLAGHIAETMILGTCSYSYHPKDEEKAFAIAKQIVFAGRKIEDMSKQMQNKCLDEAHELVATWKQEVKALLEQYKDQLQLLSQALYNHKVVPGPLAVAIMKDNNNPELRAYISKTHKELVEEFMQAQEKGQEAKTNPEETEITSASPEVAAA